MLTRLSFLLREDCPEAVRVKGSRGTKKTTTKQNQSRRGLWGFYLFPGYVRVEPATKWQLQNFKNQSKHKKIWVLDWWTRIMKNLLGWRVVLKVKSDPGCLIHRPGLPFIFVGYYRRIFHVSFWTGTGFLAPVSWDLKRTLWGRGYSSEVLKICVNVFKMFPFSKNVFNSPFKRRTV